MGYRQYLPLSLGKPVFFVSPHGSDANGAGTFENPWRTISRGVSNLSGWDTLYIREGTYVEHVIINRSGTADAPITIAAYPGEQVIIDGEAGVDGLNSGLPSKGELFGTESRDGTGFRYTPLVSIEANYIVFEGINVTRSMGRGIRVWRNGKQVRGVTIRNCNISFSRKNGLMLELNCKDITVDECSVSRSGNFAPYPRTPDLDWGGAVAVKGSHNITFRRTHIHENWGEGIIADSQTNGSSNLTISECVFYDNMAPSIYLHAVSDVLVENNLLYHSDNSEFPPSEGIALSPAERQYGANVDTKDVTIVNNIVAGFGSNLGFHGPDDRYLRRVRVLFNTLINAQDHGILDSSLYVDCELKNNLVYQSNGKPLANSWGHFSGCALSHNAWSNTPPGYVRSSSDVIGDPQLENPRAARPRGQVDSAWYKIKPNSPVIGQADAHVLVGHDFFGAKRDSDPDMGAHELQTAAVATGELIASTDGKARPLFYAGTAAATLSEGGFKRFVILSSGAAAGPDNVEAFGIQFPDRQCLVYAANQENGPAVFDNVDQALDGYKKEDALIRWVD